MAKSPYILAVAATLMMSTATFAASDDFAKLDANADGKLTLEEGLKLHPDWTESAFKSLDTNADGALSEIEYEAAATMAPAGTEPVATTTDSAAPAETTQTGTMRKDGPASYLEGNGPNDVLASNLIGMRVYAVEADIDDRQAYPVDSRKDWNDVGEVNDVILDWDGGVKAVVLGVGGFLGIGEKDVAIEMSSLRRVRETNESNDWFLVVNSSKDLLTNAPTYTRNAKP